MFSVPSTKTKEPENNEESSTSSLVQVSSSDPLERRGFGFPKENEKINETEDDKIEKTESDSVITSKKPSAITFVKSTDENITSNSNIDGGNVKEDGSVGKPKEISEAKKTEMKELMEPIIEKLKFLSEGSTPASAVQSMAIQIQVI